MISMAKWKIALETFLKEWQDKEEVVGALVLGAILLEIPLSALISMFILFWRKMWDGGKEGIVLLMVF